MLNFCDTKLTSMIFRVKRPKVNFIIIALALSGINLPAQAPLGLHVAGNQVVLFGEDTASLGDKLLWIPAKGALFTGNMYQPLDSIGNRSFASGQSVASGEGSAALGFSGARANYSAALCNSSALGNFSMSAGLSTTFGPLALATGNSIASGYGSVALGLSVATANTAVALGNARANGMTSAAFNLSRADAFMCTTVGRYNVGGGSTTSFNAFDPIFEVGIGSSETNRSNALTVLKNGQVMIPNGYDASLSLNGYLTIGSLTGANIVIDNNEIMARNNGQTGSLYLNHDGGNLYLGGNVMLENVPYGDYGNLQLNTNNGQIYWDNSSRRHKQNIRTLTDDWNKILQSRPVTYTRPGNEGRWEFGYIAEEMDSIGLKNLVDYDSLGLPQDFRYDKMVIYLTEMIKIQQGEIDRLRRDMETLRKAQEDLVGRLSDEGSRINYFPPEKMN